MSEVVVLGVDCNQAWNSRFIRNYLSGFGQTIPLPLVSAVYWHDEFCGGYCSYSEVMNPGWASLGDLMSLSKRNWDQLGDKTKAEALILSPWPQFRLSIAYLLGSVGAVAQSQCWRYCQLCSLLKDDCFEVRERAVSSLAEVCFGRDEWSQRASIRLREFAASDPLRNTAVVTSALSLLAAYR